MGLPRKYRGPVDHSRIETRGFEVPPFKKPSNNSHHKRFGALMGAAIDQETESNPQRLADHVLLLCGRRKREVICG